MLSVQHWCQLASVPPLFVNPLQCSGIISLREKYLSSLQLTFSRQQLSLLDLSTVSSTALYLINL